MSELDDLRQSLGLALNQGTKVISATNVTVSGKQTKTENGVTVVKAIPSTDVLKILKSKGVLSAEELAIDSPKSLLAKINSNENNLHPEFKNVIYCSASFSKEASKKLKVNDIYGNATIVIKESVLQRPNTTYTYFDTLDDRYSRAKINLFKGQLLTNSELIKAHQEEYSPYIEVQIRSKINLNEIEKIVFHDAPPTTEEKALADLSGVPLEYKGAIVAGNIPEQPQITPQQPVRPTPLSLPTPTITPFPEATDETPVKLPDFPDLPKSLLPSTTPKPLKPVDPIPNNRIPNFKEFKDIDDACAWLEQGKDLTVDFPIANLPGYLKFCAENGNAGIWYQGNKYIAPF